MNLEKFFLVSETLVDILSEAAIPAVIQKVVGGLNNQINSPGDAHLKELSDALDQLSVSYTRSKLSTVPQTWSEILAVFNIGNVLDPDYPSQVRAIISQKEPLLNEARDIIQADHQKIQSILGNFSQIQSAFRELGIAKAELEPGEAELSVLIPEELFSQELRKFTKDVNAFERFVSACSEVATGQVEHVKLKQISTTDPILFLYAAAPTVLLVLEIVNSILAGYHKTQEIRLAKKQIEALDLDMDVANQLEEAEKSHMITVVHEVVVSLKEKIGKDRSVEEADVLETKLERLVLDTA